MLITTEVVEIPDSLDWWKNMNIKQFPSNIHWWTSRCLLHLGCRTELHIFDVMIELSERPHRAQIDKLKVVVLVGNIVEIRRCHNTIVTIVTFRRMKYRAKVTCENLQQSVGREVQVLDLLAGSSWKPNCSANIASECSLARICMMMCINAWKISRPWWNIRQVIHGDAEREKENAVHSYRNSLDNISPACGESSSSHCACRSCLCRGITNCIQSQNIHESIRSWSWLTENCIDAHQLHQEILAEWHAAIIAQSLVSSLCVCTDGLQETRTCGIRQLHERKQKRMRTGQKKNMTTERGWPRFSAKQSLRLANRYSAYQFSSNAQQLEQEEQEEEEQEERMMGNKLE